ncbi:DUF4190 domain-containing protein [Saccharopolyspora rosea]|uniref:DUF4190 domain-containing protein n=1 Tax=Saccharopolyspora rosea TaxID=524884 RepID=A0ABW3FUW0_9PSEU|nr:DUF4190 domain-containing protein [Saccharopolyspora rosea]
MTNPNQPPFGNQPQPAGPPSYPPNMPPPPPAYPTAGGYPYAGFRQTHSLATASLILSLVGSFCVLTAIAAVITGHMARKRIREDPRYDGAGIALAGLIIGWVIIAGWLMYVAFMISIVVLGANGQLH